MKIDKNKATNWDKFNFLNNHQENYLFMKNSIKNWKILLSNKRWK